MFRLLLSQGGQVQGSYSDSPHCSDYLHPAAGATHLQTANVLQNDRERLNDCQFEEINAPDCLGSAGLAFCLFRAVVISGLIDRVNFLSQKYQIFDHSSFSRHLMAFFTVL